MVTKRPNKKQQGLFVYCQHEEKERIKAMAKATRRSLSAYVMHRLMPQVEVDEQKLKSPRK